MIYRIEYQIQASRVWLFWREVAGLDEARVARREMEKLIQTTAIRVLKQTWTPVDLETER